MPFPVSLSGEVTVRDVTVEQALDRLEGALAKAKALALRREGSALQFRGGPFMLLSSWNVLNVLSNVLVPLWNAVVKVASSANGISISYRVTFRRVLVVVTLMVGAFFGPFVMAALNTSCLDAERDVGEMETGVPDTPAVGMAQRGVRGERVHPA